MMFCCAKFGEMATKDNKASGAFERMDDNTWSVNGCCGGGCFVLNAIKFCPFCGADLKKQATAQATET